VHLNIKAAMHQNAPDFTISLCLTADNFVLQGQGWVDYKIFVVHQPSKTRSEFGNVDLNADLSTSQVGKFLPTLIQPM
jgi:hypothetical protein